MGSESSFEFRSSMVEVFEVRRPVGQNELDVMKDVARKIFGDLNSMPMHALIRCGDGKLLAIVPDDDINKHVFVEVVRAMARRGSADMALICTEAWFAQGVDEDKRPPCDRPDRKEGVIIVSESTTGTSMWMAEITRKSDEECELGKFTDLGSESVGGTMTGLLPPN